MKRLLWIAAAGLLMSNPMSVMAQGKSVDVGASVETGGKPDAAGASSNAQGEGQTDGVTTRGQSSAALQNYGQLISGLRTNAVSASEIDALGDEVSVTTVLLSQLRGEAGENAAALDLALQTTDMTQIRATLEANADIAAQLEADGVSVEDVVGIWISADGAITVVVDDTV